MIGSRARAALLALALLPAPTAGNGWEHAAVPFEALVESLSFEGAHTRQRAAESLGFRGQTEAVPALLDALARPEPDPHVRGAIHVALGRLGDPDALPALDRCLDAEPRDDVRADCAHALGLLALPVAAPIAIRALERDDSLLVRRRAIEALGALATREAVEVLARIVRDPPGPGLRAPAVRALGAAGREEGTGVLLDRLADADSDETRARVVDALAGIGSPRVVPALERLLDATEDTALRARIARALAASRAGDALPALVALLDDPSSATRWFAIEGLHRLGRPEAVAPIAALAERLADRMATKVPVSDAEALATRLAGLTLLERALRALVDLDPRAGADALLAAAAPRATARDSAAALRLAEGVYEVRRTALHGLGYTGRDEARALLRGPAGIGDPDPRLRAVAVRSLGVLGGERLAETVLPLLDDPSPDVRAAAARVLGRLDDDHAIPALADRLSDPHAMVREEAARALGWLGAADDASVRDALVASREDPDPRVREAAAWAATR